MLSKQTDNWADDGNAGVDVCVCVCRAESKINLPVCVRAKAVFTR